MFRGTTPLITFEIGTDADEIETAELTFVQEKEIVMTKHLRDFIVSGTTLGIRLTQQETLSLVAKPVVAQLRFRMKDNTAWASEIFTFDVEGILQEGII